MYGHREYRLKVSKLIICSLTSDKGKRQENTVFGGKEKKLTKSLSRRFRVKVLPFCDNCRLC